VKEAEGLKVISGGQTGVDRAALDAAIEAGIPYAGWCPKGGWAEDCPDPPGLLALYAALRETPESAPEQRTAWNVRDSDALMVVTDRAGLAVSKGTALAVSCAADQGKPYVVVDIDAPNALTKARAWLKARGGGALCVAGPRESEAPGIGAKAKLFLAALLED
jgi:putative molybdenum carrier protein